MSSPNFLERSLETIRDRLPGFDNTAARKATVIAFVVLLGLSGVQTAVGMAFTGGQQPISAVESVPMDPQSDVWANAESRTIEMQGQQMAKPWGGGSTDAVTVRAVTNETHVAFKLTWDDPTNDSNLASPQNYSDAAAVMLKTGSQPPITMGAVGDPVNIWYWRSAWQYGNQSRRGDWTGDMYAYPHPDNETRPGQQAGNPLSRATYDQFAQNYYAKGYGSLSYARTQPTTARAERTDDGWSVVFVRERSADGSLDATFDTSEKVYLAFAVWNGSADEVNGQKSLTYQYSVLDGDTLQATNDQTGDSGDSGSSDGTAAGTATGSDSGGDPIVSNSFQRGITTVLAVTFVAWLLAYRSIKRGED